ncbi:MAG: hypothetical protein JNJ59_19300, partial [Deltaproteobacteria bacterium]|nr:hypothetical protein [Deltaproteobacteria bacterium]
MDGVAAQRDAIGIVAEPAMALVLAAGIELGGRRTRRVSRAEAWELLARGELGALVCDGAPRGEDEARGRVVWVREGRTQDVLALDAVVRAVDRMSLLGQSSPRDGSVSDALARQSADAGEVIVGGARAEPAWRSPVGAIAPLELLGALVALRPTLRIVVEGDAGLVGLCLVEGRVTAAALEGAPIFGDPAIRSDPALALVVEIWAETMAHGEARATALNELSFVCEHDALFSASPAFVRHVTRVLATLAQAPIRALEVEAHTPSEHGVPLGGVALGALTALDATLRRRWLSGQLVAPTQVPPWLKLVLEPRRFGRVFFELADGAALASLPHAGLSADELEAGVLLAVLTGVVASAPPALPADAVVPGPTASAERAVARVEPAVAQVEPAVARVEPIARTGTCGSEESFFETLASAAAESRARGRRKRLTGTRLEPVGYRAGRLRLYYAHGEGTFGELYI